MKIKYLLVLTVFLNHFCYGQKCDEDSLFQLFKKDIQIELARHHYVEWDDETRESYYTLMLTCPTETLVTYVDDSIPAIRCLIFVGLAQKNVDEQLLTEILSKHKNDTAEYIDGATDLVMASRVNLFMKMTLDWKAAQKIPAFAGDFASRLEIVKNKLRVIVPGAYHGLITKEALLSVDSLHCSWKDHKIVSFSLSNGKTTVTTNNVFNEQMKNLIRNTRAGDILYVDDIWVEISDKGKRKLSYVRLEIK